MEAREIAIEPETLLAHSEWVRRLARRMLEDESLAEDVVQETWVATLARPTRGVDDLGAWMSGVARNLARRSLRARVRRRDREERVEPMPPPPTPEEILEQERVRKRVVDAVLALHEPYRTAVILRYWQDLAPAEIARRLGVPAATVRTRLKRALDTMRERLGARGPGSEARALRSGLAMLAMSSAPMAPTTPMPLSLLAAARAAGGLFMSAKTILSLFAIAVALALVWLGTHDFGAAGPEPASALSQEDRDDDVSSTAEAATTLLSKAEVERTAPEGVQPAASPDGHDDTWHLAIARRIGSLSGLVLARDSLQPAADARVTARPSPGLVPLPFRVADDRTGEARTTRTDSAGRFRLEELPEGPYDLDVVSEGGLVGRGQGAAQPEGGFVRIELAPKVWRTDYWVRVVDGAGEPEVGAEVSLWGHTWDGPRRGRIAWTGVTDGRGEAVFEDSLVVSEVVIARAGDGRSAMGVAGEASRESSYHVLIDPGGRRILQLELAPTGSIEGRADGAEGALVSAWPKGSFHKGIRHAVASARVRGGRFLLEDLPGGAYHLTADGCGPLRSDLSYEAFSGARQWKYELPAVEVLPGETIRADLRLVVGPSVEGQVLRAVDGSPIEGARVVCELPRRSSPFTDYGRICGVPGRFLSLYDPIDTRHPLLARETRTDASGHYRFDGLLPGPGWRVEVFVPGLALDRRMDLTLDDDRTETLQHELVPAGGIQGIALRKCTLSLRRIGEEAARVVVDAHEEDRALFTVPGLPAGLYRIDALDWPGSCERIAHLAEVEVRAGELSWIDLASCAPVLARGRILHRGEPVPDAIVRFAFARALTDEQGRFELRDPFDKMEGLCFEVLVPGVEDSALLSWRFPEASAGGPGPDVHLPAGALEVAVVDESGAPLQAMVRIECQEEEPPHSEPVPPTGLCRMREARHRTDARGRARFGLLPSGVYSLSAQVGGEAAIPPVLVDVPPGGRVQETLILAFGGRVEVLVTGWRDDEPYPDALVELLLPGEGGETPTDRRRTDEEGLVVFERVRPGPVRARLLWPRIGPYHRGGRDCEARDGETVRVVLPMR